MKPESEENPFWSHKKNIDTELGINAVYGTMDGITIWDKEERTIKTFDDLCDSLQVGGWDGMGWMDGWMNE